MAHVLRDAGYSTYWVGKNHNIPIDAWTAGGSEIVAIAVFTAIAAASVAVPVIAYLVASSRMAGPLESMHQWLVKENDAVMAVLLLVIGVAMIGKGIGSF